MKKEVKITITAICLWFLVIGSLYYIFYMKRVDDTFAKNKELGKITKVKYDNFLLWISTKKGYNFIKLKVYTKDKVYKVCSILKDFSYETDTIGYIINNKIYMEEGN